MELTTTPPRKRASLAGGRCLTHGLAHSTTPLAAVNAGAGTRNPHSHSPTDSPLDHVSGGTLGGTAGGRGQGGKRTLHDGADTSTESADYSRVTLKLGWT